MHSALGALLRAARRTLLINMTQVQQMLSLVRVPRIDLVTR
jgi:hypothetical protein